MIQTEAERQRELLIKRLTEIAQKKAAQNIKIRQWALEYVRSNGVENAETAVREAQTLLDFLADELSQETDA